MAWIMDTYAMTIAIPRTVCVTVPISIGGSEGRGEATARGLLTWVGEPVKLKRSSLSAARPLPIQDLAMPRQPRHDSSPKREAKIVARSDRAARHQFTRQSIP